MESLNNEKPLYFYREHLDNQKEGNPFVIYQRSDGQDIWGVNLFYSHHANKFHFLEKLTQLNTSQIPAFLKFHLDKYPGDKTDWIEFVFNSIHNYKRDTEDRINRNNDPTKKIGYKNDFLLNESPKYNIIIEWLNKASTEPQQNNLRGFQSSLTDSQIQALFSQLKGSYIDLNTNPDHFKALFKNEPLPPALALKWLKTNVLLAYLVKHLFNENNPFDSWVKAGKIFNIKNLQKSECNNPFPKGHENLKSILNSIYIHL